MKKKRYSIIILGIILITLLSSGRNLIQAQDTLIARESVWKYLDDGSDQGTAWKEFDFDASSWAQGPAQLGYGNKGEVTLLSYGSDPDNKYPAYYFRRNFYLKGDPAEYGDSLGINIHLDDGAVLYLNGTEVLRINMPEGEITYQSIAAGNAIASSAFIPFKFSTEHLLTGVNVLAVSVHQEVVTSSDIQFDMDLFSFVSPDPYPVKDSILIEENSVWKYLDDGSDQGTAWKEPNFYDGTWSQGPAQLGYGGKGEVTLLSYGPDPDNKYPAYYLRQKFNISDAATYGDSLGIRIHLDDGAVLYLNGAEVLRVNMPEGEITYQSLAADDAIASSSFLRYNISAENLISGVNTLAVSVHQMSVSSSDVQFELEMIKIDQSVIKDSLLIEKASVWKYLDDGSDQGSGWKEPGFDESSWAEGPAQLGYGNKGEATLLSYGPDENNKYPAYYFRQSFNIGDPAAFGDSLGINIHLDDGAVLYLNGAEVLRVNMPEGEITYQSLAADDAIASSSFLRYNISAENLTAGKNVLAVSVHQMSVSSSDIQFDMEMFRMSNTVGIKQDGTIPDSYSLFQNYPNPFNPSTKISFALHQRSKVRLEIFDALGRIVATLIDGDLQAGIHESIWNAVNLSSGTYVYRLTTDNFIRSQKMMLIK